MSDISNAHEALRTARYAELVAQEAYDLAKTTPKRRAAYRALQEAFAARREIEENS